MTDQQFTTIVGLLERIANAVGSRVDSAGQLDDEAKAAKMKCPDCGGHMTLRKARTSGKSFVGCTGYPECKGMRWLNGEVPKPRSETSRVSRPAVKQAVAEPAQASGSAPPEDDVPF